MPKKWVRNSEWRRSPHVKEGPPPSLWWYFRPDRQRVISAYLETASKGRTLATDFEDMLGTWLSDLSKIQNKKRWGQARTYRYWDIASYARDSGVVKEATLMKYLRRLEEIAMHLFPSDVPSSRKKRSSPLTGQEMQEIKRRYLQGEDAKSIAEAFRIPSSQVGLLCREEKAIRAEQRERAQAQAIAIGTTDTTGTTSSDDFEESF
jgi:hypothetical protein